MNITLEKSSNVDAILKVAITEADYKEKVEKKLKDYRKQANFKGFRPGMVPMTMVKKMFGKAILGEEINSILSTSISEYLKENKLPVVGDPLPVREDEDKIDWDNDTDFNFSYEVGLAGDFSVNLKAIAPQTAYEITNSEKEIAETIESIRNQFGTQIDAESFEKGDMIFGTFSQGDWSEKSAIPSKAIKEDEMATFLGKKPEEVVTFDIRKVFVDEKSIGLATAKKGDDLTNFTGEVSFTIEKITRRTAAELNQELFDSVLGAGKVSSEEEFNTEVKNIISENFQRESEFLVRSSTQKAVIDSTEIELPDTFLKKWLVQINEGKFTAEQIDADFDQVKRDIKWSLIKNEIADKNDIKVEYADVLEKSKVMVRQQFGMMNNSFYDHQMEDMIHKIALNYLKDTKNGNNFMDIYNIIYADRVLDVLVANIKKDSKQVTVEEFKAIVDDLNKL